MNQVDIAVCNLLFETAPRYHGRDPRKFNIALYSGKHIVERYYRDYLNEGKYLSTEEFAQCMEAISVPFKNTEMFPLRLRPAYQHLWEP